MARSTRQQRRQRRAQAAGTPPLRPAPRQRPAEEESAEVEQRAEPRAETRAEPRSGIPFVRFVQEAIAELKKVEWPKQQQVVSGTAVVLVACLIVGAYLYANDQVWKYVVHHLLLR
ncbi:MAG TPA: preprotein translocase subunit SecE [Gaiellaceae bacterium]|nr:preprotein translocase subunit SecE [Gaiellaceae bacterium]